MHIQNFDKLSNNNRKRIALSILEAGLEAAMPTNLLNHIVKKNKILINKHVYSLSKYNSVYLIGIGKAAYAMVKVLDSIIKNKGGFIVIPKGSKCTLTRKKFSICYAGHPIPNVQSMSAAKKILNFINTRQKNDLIIFLISGGASSLLCLPDSISLNEKQRLTKLLLHSGAAIQEINCVRKHLSQVKGGRLIKNMQCNGVSLVMSDVIGDDLSSIGSGTTYYDKSTYKDALNVIKKYNLVQKLSKKTIERLKLGMMGKISETPKKSRIKNFVVATNYECLMAMKSKAKNFGLVTKVHHPISGDVRKAANLLTTLIPNKKNSCIIFGGETTVQVRGKGKGGRNQELVLRIAKKCQHTNKKIIISSIGTDGIDGNTNYAGAIVENDLVKNRCADLFLKNNNSNSFFMKYGGLVRTGYTHTNLMDIGIILN